MNTLRKNILVTVAALGLAGSALAQSSVPAAASAASPTGISAPQARHPRAMSDEQRAALHAKRAERQAERAAKLRAELKLTPQQESAFAAYLAAGKPAGHPEARGERGQFAALPAPQRLERMIERQKQRTARMEARLAALNNLYAVLTPEQKKVLDSRPLGGGFGGRHHGHHGHHGERGAAVQS